MAKKMGKRAGTDVINNCLNPSDYTFVMLVLTIIMITGKKPMDA